MPRSAKKRLAGLEEAGHEVDLLDLYAEGFDPVLTAERRRDYHDPERNRRNNEAYVDRLMAANALVVQFPTWSFGPPAMLKGWFDRMFGPGIALDLSDPGQAKPMLLHIERITGISTYGRPRWQAIGMADPPRKIIKRYLPWFTGSQDAGALLRALPHEHRDGGEARPFSGQKSAGRWTVSSLSCIGRSRDGLDFDHEFRLRVKPVTIIKVEAGGVPGNCRSRTAYSRAICSRPVT